MIELTSSSTSARQVSPPSPTNRTTPSPCTEIHITSSPPVFQAIGRELAGLAEGEEWVFLNLVKPPAN